MTMTPPTDKTAATAFIVETFDSDPTLCPVWLANNRAAAIQQASSLAMLARQEAEWRTRRDEQRSTAT